MCWPCCPFDAAMRLQVEVIVVGARHDAVHVCSGLAVCVAPIVLVCFLHGVEASVMSLPSHYCSEIHGSLRLLARERHLWRSSYFCLLLLFYGNPGSPNSAQLDSNNAGVLT